MKFYSYDYVLSQISQQDWVMIIVSTLLVIVTGFFAFKAFKIEMSDNSRNLLPLLSLKALNAKNPVTITKNVDTIIMVQFC